MLSRPPTNTESRVRSIVRFSLTPYQLTFHHRKAPPAWRRWGGAGTGQARKISKAVCASSESAWTKSITKQPRSKSWVARRRGPDNRCRRGIVVSHQSVRHGKNIVLKCFGITGLRMKLCLCTRLRHERAIHGQRHGAAREKCEAGRFTTVKMPETGLEPALPLQEPGPQPEPALIILRGTYRAVARKTFVSEPLWANQMTLLHCISREVGWAVLWQKSGKVIRELFLVFSEFVTRLSNCSPFRLPLLPLLGSEQGQRYTLRTPTNHAFGDPDQTPPAYEAWNGPVAQASGVRGIRRGPGCLGRVHICGGH